jgi:iron uptake system EfeUOB component EfeO/EfeM
MARRVTLAWSVALAGLALTSTAQAAQRPCASYPAPGTLAPVSTSLPAWLTARYAVLAQPRRAVDALAAGQLSSQLSAAGLVVSRARFLGPAAFGGRIYVVPAQHLLSFTLAPARCLPAAERSLAHELHASLVGQYRHWALCVVVLRSQSMRPSCGAADAAPAALLSATGTSGFGLVPNGVADVTLSYLSAPARTIRVRDNFFSVLGPRQSVTPCALQWEDVTANVIHTFAGCDYGQLLANPLLHYRQYVQVTLAELQSQVATLAAAVGAGNVGAAQADWLTAHETWLDIGQDDGPYSAYGALGSALDGTAAGLPQGSADPDFTGFHKVELDLFQNHDLGAAAADTATLKQVVSEIVATRLTVAFPDTPNGIANWILRPHETLEDAIRDTLSANDDYGSSSGVASITADVSATREFLKLLKPVLGPLRPSLIPRADAQLTALDRACLATRVDGAWVAVADLGTRQREQIDADADAAAETLSAVPDILTTVGTGGASA